MIETIERIAELGEIIHNVHAAVERGEVTNEQAQEYLDSLLPVDPNPAPREWENGWIG